MRRVTRKLAGEVDDLRFEAPVTHVYNPLVYARRSYDEYVARYCVTKKEVVFIGMNPGPYGMSQTGVPFGEISWVRDWLEIEKPVGQPDTPHPKRPVQGFDCTRREVSGDRLWGTIAEHFGTPKQFFARHFIANYCPLVFMEESGRNRTPDKLPASEREPLFEACDRHLVRVVELLQPDWVIGVGAFATRRAEAALEGFGSSAPQVATILHPSPANPRANADWAGIVRGQLADLGLCKGCN
ncbi:MAG: single-stranded DNA-binding protein [Myxococcota bacterium]|jgi:single-strand selective monofunctional uracil DNA glycosylase|nr:single-stranded DNA-binding protein [Myxococcota bacterium]